ncbi:ribonuclease III [Pedobacter arcticus]|uniref:ribonuclease III n=1 Tax=Pedobacter arcticus TaxID=752140 RepID=UPI0002D90910|nr:ribonuclease III [Pedobacter arcticus]
MPLAKIYKLHLSPDRKYVKRMKNLLGFVPGNLALYKMAFRHRSMALVLKNGSRSSNERLEFLGDAVLGSVIAEVLFKLYPYKDEGFLTELRSKIVRRDNLNQLGRKLGFQELIDFDSKTINVTTKQSSLLGDAFEALIGAVYLDKGYDFTKSFISDRIIKPHVDIHTLELTETNFKSKLIEWCQSQSKEISFEPTANAEGDSNKLFSVQVLINGEAMASATDYSKKNAEKLAAEKTCEMLSI